MRRAFSRHVCSSCSRTCSSRNRAWSSRNRAWSLTKRACTSDAGTREQLAAVHALPPGDPNADGSS